MSRSGSVEALEYGPPRLRSFSLTLVGTVGAVVSVLLLVGAVEPLRRYSEPFWAGLVLVASVVLAVAFGWRVLRTTPLLTLDEKGFDDRSSWFPGRRVPWDQVISIDLTGRRGQRMIHVLVFRPSEETGPADAGGDEWALSPLEDPSRVAIAVSVLDADPEDVLAAMMERWGAAGSRT